MTSYGMEGGLASVAIYHYKGLDGQGKKMSGVIDAETPVLARVKLRRGGIFPTEVSSTNGNGPTSSPLPSRIALSDTAVATRQLSTLLNAGIPLVEALTSVIEQTEKAAIKKVWGEIRERVKEGASFADALRGHPTVFPALYCQMVRAGEASGALNQIASRLAAYLEGQISIRSKIVSLLAYPMLMLVLSILMLFFLLGFVVPKVTAIFEDMKQALPLPTVILLYVSDLLRDYGWALILSLMIAGVAFRRHLNSPQGKEDYDRLILKVPLVGRVVRMVAVSRFTRTLATLLSSGVPLLSALEIVEQVVGNKTIATAIRQARGGVREGESLSEPLKRSGLFPHMATQMIAIGEKSGTLERMLENLSTVYDNEVEILLTRLAALLGPLIILGIGAVILFIVLAVLLPIFEVSQMVR